MAQEGHFAGLRIRRCLLRRTPSFRPPFHAASHTAFHAASHAAFHAGATYHANADAKKSELAVNLARLTNVGTFRAYMARYLKSLPKVHGGMTFLVRQLPPTELGLPIEMYFFTSTTAWVEYEDIQADIFDHLLAALPEFGLRAFQRPSGADFAGLVESSE